MELSRKQSDSDSRLPDGGPSQQTVEELREVLARVLDPIDQKDVLWAISIMYPEVVRQRGRAFANQWLRREIVGFDKLTDEM